MRQVDAGWKQGMRAAGFRSNALSHAVLQRVAGVGAGPTATDETSITKRALGRPHLAQLRAHAVHNVVGIGGHQAAQAAAVAAPPAQAAHSGLRRGAHQRRGIGCKEGRTGEGSR